MKRLIRGLMAGLAAVPLAVFAATSAAPPASAEDNGVGLTPAMGWSSWSFIRHNPTEADIEAQAAAMKSSGLASVGYRYVNVDDFWCQCPGSQGPNVDQYGRWVIDGAKFPSSGSINGIQPVANDYDSIEVGNGSNDGLTYDERQTQLSLWALAASPLILGTDLTNLDPTDLALLKNTAVISVDQDSIDASRISDTPASQILCGTT
ncbi:MAG TPA: hypothetical protein VE733_08040 [Streptosporangiaceae bacterium]|jgi:hypothetical protein|nr:hypothetical protein [Streptosporangiaceae bacterium]